MDDNKRAVLLEDLISQVRTFGAGLQLLTDQVKQGFETTNNRMDKVEAKMDQRVFAKSKAFPTTASIFK